MRSISALLLFVSALFTAACSSQNPKGLDVDKAFRPLIWPETKILVGIDLQKLKATPIYKKHQGELEQLFNRSGAERFGIDLRRDVEYVGVSSDGKRTLFFAKGNFKNRKKTESLVFPNDRIALAGDAESIRSALALEQKGTGEVPEELAARIHSLSANDQAWVVSRGKLPIADAPLRNDTRSNLANFVNFINGMTVGIAADSGARLDARFSCISPEGATHINDGFRGLLGLARLSTKDSETDLLKVYDAFQVKKDQSTVTVDADLPSAQTERLLQLLLSRSGNRMR